MQPSGAPEALQGRSEQPQSAVSMLPERLTRARNASHTPPRLWQEVRRPRVRIEAGDGRKPAQSSSSRPPDHDWDVTNRLHRLLNRRPANQTPLKTRGTHPTRASAVKPAKTRTPTDATPPCITQKPPPAVSQSTTAAATRAAIAAGSRVAAIRTWAHVAAAPPPPPSAHPPPPHAPSPPAPDASPTLPTLPAGLPAELAAIAARLASAHTDLCVLLRTDGTMLFGTALDDVAARWPTAGTLPTCTRAAPPALPGSSTGLLPPNARARRDRLRMMLRCAALDAASAPEHADVTAATAAATAAAAAAAVASTRSRLRRCASRRRRTASTAGAQCIAADRARRARPHPPASHAAPGCPRPCRRRRRRNRRQPAHAHTYCPTC